MPATNAIPVRAEFAPNAGAASFYLRYGDLNRPLEATLYNAAGQPCDLSTVASVVFEFIPGGVDGVVLQRNGVVGGTPTAGKVSYSFVVGDFDGSQFGYGRYQFLIKITFSDAVTVELPSDRHYLMEVRPAAGFPAPASLNRKPTLAVAEVSRYTLSANQSTGLTVGSRVLFDRRTAVQDQSIVLLNGSSQITVKKGWRVRFDLAFAPAFSAASGSATFSIYNVTTGQTIWDASAPVRPPTDSTQQGSDASLVVIAEANEDTTFEVRIASATALSAIQAAGTQLVVSVVNKIANLVAGSSSATTSTANPRKYWGAVANQAAMLAVAAAIGDWVKRTDTGTIWELIALPATSVANWVEYPTGGASTVRPLQQKLFTYNGSPLSIAPATAEKVIVIREGVVVPEDNPVGTGDYYFTGNNTVTPNGGAGWANGEKILVYWFEVSTTNSTAAAPIYSDFFQPTATGDPLVWNLPTALAEPIFLRDRGAWWHSTVTLNGAGTQITLGEDPATGGNTPELWIKGVLR